MTVESVGSIAGVNVGSPDWWRDRLYKQIADRRPSLDFFNSYYIGDHPLPWLAPQARSEFKRILEMTRSNYMGLVVDAQVERMHVEGFRLGTDSASDDESWRMWQANGMDSDSDQAFLEAGIGGTSYYCVEHNLADPKTPRITVEHGSQAITESVPGNRRLRKAGLKLWVDDWTGTLCSTLFLLDDENPAAPRLFVYKYEAAKPRDAAQGATASKPDWQRRTVKGEEWGADGKMDRVPLIPIENNPRMLTGGVSELYDLTDSQDRVNKTLADRLITQDYGSFPQKWASAWPDEDAEGNENKIDIGRNRMITTEVVETKFGQFVPAALDPYSAAKKEDVHDIAARSRTPAQYLLGEMSNVNGETLKASESGLIAKVRQRMRPVGEATEEAMRCARIMSGAATDSDPMMEVVWANPEFRTEGEVTDAAIKRRQTGLSSLRQSRVDVGYSETTIKQMEKDDANEVVAPVIQRALRDVRDDGARPPVGG